MKNATIWISFFGAQNPYIYTGSPRVATGNPRVLHGLGKHDVLLKHDVSPEFHGFPRLIYGFSTGTTPKHQKKFKKCEKRWKKS